MTPRLKIELATSLREQPCDAVLDLKRQFSGLPTSGLLFFCSSQYDLPVLGKALRENFPGSIVGCTTSGQIGPLGFQLSGIVAVAISSPEMVLTPHLIRGLKSCEKRVAEIATEIQKKPFHTGWRSFGLLLVDGLSMAEELLTAILYQSIGNVPIIGGSAGDDLRFEKTFVYHDGEFVSDAATFVLFETSLPFQLLKFQHFVPTDKKLVITSADPEQRIIYEINGEPASEAYAALVGCCVDQLSANVFSANPLMLKIQDEYYVRSIQKANPDGSLTLFCAIEDGIVLTIGKGVDAEETAQSVFHKVCNAFIPELIIGCDCILRRLELENAGRAAPIGELFAKYKVLGFSTYGEQYNSIHVNQTFTGVAIGA
jgi:hypothetical protein